MSIKESKYLKGVVLASISSASFGLIPFFSIPLMASGLELNSLVVYRFLLACLFLGGLMWYRKVDLKISLKEGLLLFFVSIFYSMTALFLTASYDYVASSIATTIHFLYPLAVILISVIFFKEKLSLKIALATLCGFGGVYLLCGAGKGGEIQTLGLVYVLITVFTYSTFLTVSSRSALKDMDSLKKTFYVILFSGVILLANVLIRDGGHFDRVPADTLSWVRLICVALIPTLVSNLTLMLALKRIGPTTCAILGCMEPLTAAFVGVFVFSEAFGMLQIAGAVLAIGAVTLVLKD